MSMKEFLDMKLEPTCPDTISYKSKIIQVGPSNQMDQFDQI